MVVRSNGTRKTKNSHVQKSCEVAMAGKDVLFVGLGFFVSHVGQGGTLFLEGGQAEPPSEDRERKALSEKKRRPGKVWKLSLRMTYLTAGHGTEKMRIHVTRSAPRRSKQVNHEKSIP